MSYVEVRGVRIGEGIPKICVPIVGQTKEEICQAARGSAEIPLDLVEWRVDWFEQVMDENQLEDVAKELREILGNVPILFTFRTAEEGGEKAIELPAYVALCKKICQTGLVDLIDVEAFRGEGAVKEIIDYAHNHGVKVVASNHDFHATPDQEELVRRLCYMQEIGADIPKIAVMPQKRKDAITLLAATEEMNAEHPQTPVITMSMSGLGAISRVCGESFGSALTFGAAGKASAPGQIGVFELKEILTQLHENL